MKVSHIIWFFSHLLGPGIRETGLGMLVEDVGLGRPLLSGPLGFRNTPSPDILITVVSVWKNV